MNVADAIGAISDRLAKRDLYEARLMAEYLLAEIINTERLRLPLHSLEVLDQKQSAKLDSWTKRLAEHEPLQYVLGYTEFYGRRFKTDRRALIPRPETEELVERVLHTESLWQTPNATIADLGTGTGCIAITLSIEHPSAKIHATDISAAALDLARENAALHGIDSINWKRCDLLSGFANQSLDAVVSNPPYIASSQIAKLDRNVREFEPCNALDGGSDGLTLIGEILQQASNILRPGGWLFLEIGDEQGPAIESLMDSYGFVETSIHKDLAGHDRIVCGRKGRRGHLFPRLQS